VKLNKLRRRRGGVIDRRGAGPAGGSGFPIPGGGSGGFPMPGGGGGLPIPGGKGGMGIGAILLVLLLVFLVPRCLGSGGGLIPDPGVVEGFPDVAGGSTTEVDPQDPAGQFADAVGDDVQITWEETFAAGGRTWALSLRQRREYLPYTLTLKDFKHDVYPGTSIPKNFSSLVRLDNAGTGESRDVLIYMNQPLRYEGKTFYQASFGKDDTLSILQVVANPGWLLPYLSTVLVTVGLLIHFGISLRRGVRRAGAIAPRPDVPPQEALT